MDEVRRMKFCAALCLLLLSASATATECVPSVLAAEYAWSRLAPLGAPVMAGYAAFKNAGAIEQQIVAAKSADFERVEMHSMSMDDGMMRMRKLDHLVIPAGQTLELKPGGLHLMLIGPKREFAAGDKILVEFTTCADAPTQSVSFEVRNIEAS